MRSLSTDEYKTLIQTIRTGCGSLKANPRIAAILTAEANLGMRVGDILRLRLCDIIRDHNRLRLNIVEEKTGKKRTFTVPTSVYDFLCDYAQENGIGKDERLFDISVRQVQRYLKKVCDALGYENISTHSFRKWYATDIYEASGHDIVLVQELLQHSSAVVTRRYIGLSDEKIERAIAGHVLIA